MRRSGVTLVEMIVVLAILGLVFGVSGLALACLKAPRESVRVGQLRAARERAIRTGLPVRPQSDSPPFRSSVLFLPDGRAIGPGVDPLTGAPHDSTH